MLFGHVESGAPHACPGRGLAIGAMLGGLAALLLAGQWAPTPGPTTVMLKHAAGLGRGGVCVTMPAGSDAASAASEGQAACSKARTLAR